MNTTPSPSREAVELIQKALDAGPSEDWSLSRNGNLGVILGGPAKHYTNGSSQSQIIMTCVTDGDENKQAINALFIHACNPENIRAVLALLAAKQEEVDKMREALRELLEAHTTPFPSLSMFAGSKEAIAGQNAWGARQEAAEIAARAALSPTQGEAGK